MKQKKGKKHATVQDVPQTQESWRQLVNDLGLYDAKYEQEKYLLKEYNLTEYCLQGLELLSRIKGSFSPDSYIIALIEMNRQKNKSNEQLKLFLTSFLASFKQLQLYSNELSYITRLVSPNELPQRSSKLFTFYLKVRKYIYTNFVNERDPVVQPMQFGKESITYRVLEQWVSVVSKFLDNKAIVTIGNQIKERKKEKDKNAVATVEQNVNFVDPYDLIMLCYEEEEKRYRKKKEGKKKGEEKQGEEKEKKEEKQEKEKKENKGKDNDGKENNGQEGKRTKTQEKELEQSQEREDRKGNSKFLQSEKANQLAYKIAMGPGESSMKQSRERSTMKQDSEYSDDPEQSHKMVADINNAKQKILSDMIKQQQTFKEVLAIHESLAMNYKYVANFTQELQELVSEVIEKITKGQSVNEQELKTLEQHTNFSEFLPEDPELTLQSSGIYETLKQ